MGGFIYVGRCYEAIICVTKSVTDLKTVITGGVMWANNNISRRHFLYGSAVAASIPVLTSSLFGCTQQGAQTNSASSSSASAGPVSGNTNQVIVSMPKSSEPASGFDPLFSWGCGEHVHEPLIQSTLITTNTEMEFENDLAVAYECSSDGMEWKFTIRDDVFFTDGEPLTARDVAFTINGIKENPACECDLSMIERAEAVDNVTLLIHMQRPYNALLFDLAVIGIVPEHAYDSATYGSNPIGSGRYILEQWDRGEQVILKANPNYYGQAPSIERVIAVFMDEDASLAACLASQIDVGYTAATLVDSASPQGYEVFQCESVDSRGISLPTIDAGNSKESGGKVYKAGNSVTSNSALRKAINFATDRQRMVDRVLNGYGSVAYSVADSMPWYSEYMEVDFNLDAAKNVLEEDGWSLGSNNVYEKGDLKAEFSLYYPAGDSVRQGLANEFANQMSEVGIKVNVVGGSWTEDESGIYYHQYSDPVLWGWGSNSPTQFYSLTHSNSAGNYSVYSSDIVDAHLDAAMAADTVEASYADYQAAQWDGESGIAPNGEATWVWLVNVCHLYFKRAGLFVAEQKPHPHGHGWSLLNNVDKWNW